MLPKAFRLPLTTKRFSGKHVNQSDFHIIYTPNKMTHARFAVVIPKSVVRLATARNRLKRQLHSVFMRHPSLPPIDLLFVIKKPSASLIEDVAHFFDAL